MSHVIMRCALAARSLVAVLVVLSVPAVAFADGIFTPFAGVSFGGDQTERVPTYGVSLAGMAGGVLGFELDVAQTAEAMIVGVARLRPARSSMPTPRSPRSMAT